jgi:hypothetical protein
VQIHDALRQPGFLRNIAQGSAADSLFRDAFDRGDNELLPALFPGSGTATALVSPDCGFDSRYCHRSTLSSDRLK